MRTKVRIKKQQNFCKSFSVCAKNAQTRKKRGRITFMQLLSRIGRFSKRLAITALAITLTTTPTQAATLLGTFNFYETANIFSVITNRASSSKGTEYIVINGTENQAKEIRDEYVRQFAACADYKLIVEKHMLNQ